MKDGQSRSQPCFCRGFYQVSENLVLNLNYLVFAEDRTSHYKTIKNSEWAEGLIAEGRTCRVELCLPNVENRCVEIFHITREEFNALRSRLTMEGK